MRWIVLAILVGAGAPADAQDLRQMLCAIRADNARLIMSQRQDGRDKNRLLRIMNSNPALDRYELQAFRRSIDEAYAAPKASSTFERRQIIEDFTKHTYRRCMQQNPVNRG